jgi:uncharacterized protein
MHGMMNEGGCCGGGCGGDRGCGPEGSGPGKDMKVGWWKRCGCACGKHAKVFFLCLALLALASWLGFKAWNEAKQHKYIGVPIERNVITVSGEGKVVGIPDVANVDLGMTVERPTVAAAQKENTRVMNALVNRLKQMGVDQKDIQTTSYTVYPAYDWSDSKQTLRGYTVAQTVHVKIRNLDSLGDIIGAAGELGANQIGNIAFSVDDPETLRSQARIKAILIAKRKALALAAAAGVKLRRVVSFEESFAQPGPIPYFAKDMRLGMAGEAASAPTIEAGSSEITANVTLTYEIE